MPPHRNDQTTVLFLPFSHCTSSPDYCFRMLVKTHRSLEIIKLFLRMEQIIYLAFSHKVSPRFFQLAPHVWQFVSHYWLSGISEGEIGSTMIFMRHHFMSMKFDCISTSWFQLQDIMRLIDVKFYHTPRLISNWSSFSAYPSFLLLHPIHQESFGTSNGEQLDSYTHHRTNKRSMPSDITWYYLPVIETIVITVLTGPWQKPDASSKGKWTTVKGIRDHLGSIWCSIFLIEFVVIIETFKKWIYIRIILNKSSKSWLVWLRLGWGK